MVSRAPAASAKDIMSSPVTFVMEETPVREIARVLLLKRISAVPVINEAGSLVGMVSEGDLIGRETSDDKRRSWWLDVLEAGSHAGDKIQGYLKAHGLRAKDVMSRNVVTVGPDEPITRIAELLRAKNRRPTPVPPHLDHVPHSMPQQRSCQRDRFGKCMRQERHCTAQL